MIFAKEDLKFYKVSAKSGKNIKEAYEELLISSLKYKKNKAAKESIILNNGGPP